MSTKQYEMSTNVSYTRIILTKMNEPASYVDEPFSSLWRLESNEEKRYLTGLFHALNGGLWPFCVGG